MLIVVAVVALGPAELTEIVVGDELGPVVEVVGGGGRVCALGDGEHPASVNGTATSRASQSTGCPADGGSMTASVPWTPAPYSPGQRDSRMPRW